MSRSILAGLALLAAAAPAPAQFPGPYGDPFYGPPGYGLPYGPFGYGGYGFGGDFGYAVPMYRPPVVVFRPVYVLPRVEAAPPAVARYPIRPSPVPYTGLAAPTSPAPQPLSGVPAPTPGVPAPTPGLETGLRILEISPGPAADAGLKVGDLILGVNNKRTQTLAEARAVLAAAAAGPVPCDYVDALDGQIKRAILDARGQPLGAVAVESPVPQK